MTPNRSRVALVGIALAAACGPPSRDVRTSNQAAIPAGYRATGSIVSSARALEYLPRTAAWVVVAKSARLLEQIQVRDLLGAWGLLPHDSAAQKLDTKSLEEMGIDVGRPVGAAALHLPSSTHVVFAHVARRDRLIASMGKGNTVTRAGAATLIAGDQIDDVVLVLRGDLAFFVSSRVKSRRDRGAMRIATIGVTDSLAPQLRALGRRFGFGRDVAAWGKLADIWPPAPDDVLDDLERIRKQTRLALAGSDGQARTKLRQRLKVIDDMMRRRRASRQLHEQTIGAVTSIVAGLELDGGAVRIKMAAQTKGRVLLTRLLTMRDAPHRILGAVKDRPLLLLALHAETPALIDAVYGWLNNRGISFARLERMYAAITGGKLARDAAAILDGELGLALTVQGTVRASSDLRTRSDTHIVFGVRDRARARAVLDKLAASRLFAGSSRRTKSGRRIELRLGRTRTLYIGLAGNALLATTDPSMFARIGKPGIGFLSTVKSPALRKLLAERASAVFLADPLLIAPRAQNDEGSSLLSAPPPDSEAPISKAYQAAQKKVAELRAKVEQQRAATARDRDTHHVVLARQMGVLALIGGRGRASVVSFGGLFLPGSSVKTATSDLKDQYQKYREFERIVGLTLDAHRRELISAINEARKIRLRDIAEFELRKQGAKHPAQSPPGG